MRWGWRSISKGHMGTTSLWLPSELCSGKPQLPPRWHAPADTRGLVFYLLLCRKQLNIPNIPSFHLLVSSHTNLTAQWDLLWQKLKVS